MLLQELEAIRENNPRVLLDRAVEVLRVATESEAALFHTVANVDAETLAAVDWSVAGSGHQAQGLRGAFERGFTVSKTSAMGPASWETRFTRLEEVARRMPNTVAKLQADTTDALGVTDHLILQVSHQGCYLGPLVALRFKHESPFDRRLPTMLRALVAPLSAQIVMGNRMLRAACPEEACDLLVDPTGHVEFVSHESHVWLNQSDFHDELRRVVRRVDAGQHCGFRVPFRGAQARVVRLERHGLVRYAIHITPPPPLPVKRSLTEAEREVALLAAAGATTGDIAMMRGTSAGTVKNQMKSIYGALGVSARRA